jgi:hypothetical protein
MNLHLMVKVLCHSSLGWQMEGGSVLWMAMLLQQLETEGKMQEICV